MRKQGLFTLAFMLMLPFTAFADATVTPPPNVTMEAASGGGGRIIGGVANVYDGAESGTIRVQWPYVYHGSARKCQINTVTLSCSSTAPSGCQGSIQTYTLALDGVGYKVHTKKWVYSKNSYGMNVSSCSSSLTTNTKYNWTK